MNTQVSHRHFKKDLLIPRLSLREEKDMGLILLATPWGDESATTLAFDEIIGHMKSSQDDTEATTAFENIEILNQLENDLRTAVLIANEKVFRTINGAEYVSALELTIVIRRKHQIAWLVAGGHQLLIQNGNHFSIICGAIPHPTCPLPTHLVGVDRSCWLQCGSLNRDQGQHISVFSDGAAQRVPDQFPVSNRPVSFWSASLTLS
ncbi:MAG: hypothetical protein ACK5WZ_13040 [Pseudobdellovibrionaceae bacterium]